jgi:hypothetical protein
VPQTKEEDPVSKVYLGDGVYVDANQAGQIVLTTEDGIGVTNIIYLEPEVCETLKAYIDQAQWQKSSAPNVGDVVEVFLNGNWVLQTVKEVGSHPPYVDCIMVKGLYRWFTCGEYRAPGINNFLEKSYEEDQKCPNCPLGILEKVGNDTYRCRGECGAFFRGPCQHPNRNFNGGCNDCGDPGL